MPWCDECERFLNPNSLSADGGCPACGRVVAEPTGEGGEADGEDYKAPWHFKLMVVALVIYLAWRAFQIIERIVT
jgi:hypothetical protein